MCTHSIIMCTCALQNAEVALEQPEIIRTVSEHGSTRSGLKLFSYQLSGAPEATSKDLNFKKIPGGACPQTPLGAVYSTHYVTDNY